VKVALTSALSSIVFLLGCAGAKPSPQPAAGAPPTAPTAQPCPCAGDRDGRVVDAVVVTGNRRIETKEITDYMHTRVGTPLRRCVMERDVVDLMDSGLFESVQVGADPDGEGRAKVAVVVHELPIVRSVDLQDMAPVPGKAPKPEAVDEALLLRAETLFSTHLAEESARRLEELFDRAGRKVKVVSYVTHDVGGVDVVFKVY
jgi:outer membrane protein assembly factor BamA